MHIKFSPQEVENKIVIFIMETNDEDSSESIRYWNSISNADSTNILYLTSEYYQSIDPRYLGVMFVLSPLDYMTDT